MKYLRQYEEAGFFKNIFKSKPEKIGRDPLYKNPSKVNQEITIDKGSEAHKIVIDYLNKQTDKLQDVKEVSRKPESKFAGHFFVCITAKLNSGYLQIINNTNLFKNIKDCTIRFEIYPSYTKKEVKINWFIDIDTNNEITRESISLHNPINSITSVDIHQKKVNAIGITLSIRDNNIEESLNNVLNTIPYFFSKTSEKIIAYNKSVKRKEEERKKQEEERKKREEIVNKFKSHMEDVEDYLIDLEDMSEGEVEKTFNQNHINDLTMVFKFKIDGLEKIGNNTFTVNQKIIDIFKSLNSARERIERKIPNSRVLIEFEKTNILYIYIKKLEPKKEISLPRDEYGTQAYAGHFPEEREEEEEDEDEGW
jgi:DNA-binding protein H-NS